MTQFKRKLTTAVGAIAVATAIPLGLTFAQDKTAAVTYSDIEQTLGSVPTFFKMLPESGIAGAWAEFKGIQLNPGTKLDGKTKELIGLAVAAQIPCSYCIYGHTAFAKLNGATDQEVREAVAMAAITRHWSTVLNGAQIDLDAFRQEIDMVVQHALASASMSTDKTD